MNQDHIMSVFEIGAIISWTANIHILWKDKQVRGVSLAAQVFWLAYGIVQVYFAASLRQFWATLSFTICAAATSIYVALAFYYKNHTKA